MQPTEFSESGLIRRKIQIMIVQYTTHTTLFNQNITRVKIITEVANRKDFGKFRFNVHATTLKIAAFKTRIYCHTIIQPHTILGIIATNDIILCLYIRVRRNISPGFAQMVHESQVILPAEEIENI